jgi:ubiquinone/menaquinone biosynthesis C-methylase UbiE
MTQPRDPSHQSRSSVDSNVAFFRDSLDSYNGYVQTLDTYAAIRARIDEALTGLTSVLDIGNGGVFDYDAQRVPEIVGLDLFLDQIDKTRCPANVRFVSGSALDLPMRDGTFDGVIINMLLHHLVGRTVDESIRNVKGALGEALRVLKPGGRLILIESCTPRWFYAFERLVFRAASRVIHLFTSHPITLQYPPGQIAQYIRDLGEPVEVTRIPKGRWVLQYGVKVPSFVTPICPYRFIAQKREGSADAVQARA